MGNIKNFNFNKTRINLSNSDYWDFFLAVDDRGGDQVCSGLTSGSCFVVWYDFNNQNIFSADTSATTIYSLVSWDKGVNTGYTLDTFGLTSIDNGKTLFDKLSGDTSNQALLSALTGTTLIIPSGDTRMFMNLISGTTGNYIYPTEYYIDPTLTVGNYTNFYGGFYQGYYKLDGTTYEVLPTRVNQSWSAEFWLMPTSGSTLYSGQTLNDVYTGNSGFFFYMGTRAENKFWNTFDGVDSGCTSGCTIPSGCTDTLSDWCTIPKETDIILVGPYGIGIPLNPPLVTITLATNPFLIYGRASNGCGCNACTGSGDGLGNQTICSLGGIRPTGTPVVTYSQQITNTTNPFLIYGRASISGGCSCNACGGSGDGFGNQTICSFSGFSTNQTELDYNLDIIDNAIGFRIKDDGSIGYRLLTVTGHCITATTGTTKITGITIDEGYSVSGMVSADTWSYVVIKFDADYEDDCELKTSKQRLGTLRIYVNGRLKYTKYEFPEFIARRLNDFYQKQVGVPFNFSLGGGSQGLLETQTFDGRDVRDLGLPIETHFGGSFIGSISQFKFNICNLSFCDIQHNYIIDAPRYGINFLGTEDGFIILTEDNSNIELG